MCFGDPWEGPVPIEQVVDVSARLMDLGADQLSLGDTIGVGTTGHVSRLLDALDARGIGADRIGVHFHDTYGQALANTMTALRHGVTVVDASTGGLGGCPYAKSATGNLATEDLVWALDGAGVETGVDLASARRDERVDGRAPRSPVAVARRQGARRRRADAGLGRRGQPCTAPGDAVDRQGAAQPRRRCRGPGHPRPARGRTASAARVRPRRSSPARPPAGRPPRRAARPGSWSGRCSAGCGPGRLATCSRWYAAASSPARSAPTSVVTSSSSTAWAVTGAVRRCSGVRCCPAVGTTIPPSGVSAAGAKPFSRKKSSTVSAATGETRMVGAMLRSWSGDSSRSATIAPRVASSSQRM